MPSVPRERHLRLVRNDDQRHDEVPEVTNETPRDFGIFRGPQLNLLVKDTKYQAFLANAVSESLAGVVPVDEQFHTLIDPVGVIDTTDQMRVEGLVRGGLVLTTLYAETVPSEVRHRAPAHAMIERLIDERYCFGVSGVFDKRYGKKGSIMAVVFSRPESPIEMSEYGLIIGSDKPISERLSEAGIQSVLVTFEPYPVRPDYYLVQEIEGKIANLSPQKIHQVK